ncbi:MAG: flagellar export chaperone FlgN [Pirellulaceae bacterium]|nr:flagellar export chaperone FlgN [Pirellulaceae bacterium]
MPTPESNRDLETEIGTLLDELATVQSELLAVLRAKRANLATVDLAGLAETQVREEALARRLQDCQRRRTELLAEARQQGRQADSLGKLANLVSQGNSPKLRDRVKTAGTQMRLLQHESLSNWVLAQRALLHVSQLVEIIATGGRMQPTYGEGDSAHARGTLVNQEA